MNLKVDAFASEFLQGGGGNDERVRIQLPDRRRFLSDFDARLPKRTARCNGEIFRNFRPQKLPQFDELIPRTVELLAGFELRQTFWWESPSGGSGITDSGKTKLASAAGTQGVRQRKRCKVGAKPALHGFVERKLESCLNEMHGGQNALQSRGFGHGQRHLPAKRVKIARILREPLEVRVRLLSRMAPAVPGAIQMGVNVGELDAELGFIEVRCLHSGEQLNQMLARIVESIPEQGPLDRVVV